MFYWVGFIMVEIVKSFYAKLNNNFPLHGILDAFDIIYLQYWLQEDIKESFSNIILF